ncbi:sensor histidine kinase [Rhodoferax sediminis]|uniref:sensor histidine kinase n=1 Tax=Rhodoferax sediminis TaxID=2509614 RepID=UPI001FCF22AF|nr:histidine kinase [Rhodoferax sediminis]
MTIRCVRVLIGLVLLWLGLAWGAGAATLQLREANASITVNGATTQANVALPYNWDRMHRGQPGSATFDVAFSLAEHPSVPYEVYFVRLGNAYEVSLNGTMLERNGNLQAFNSGDYGQVPRTMALPPQLLKKDNLLHIRIRADTGRRGGVPAVVVGPDHEVDALYNAEYRWRVTGSEVVVILSLLVGTMALALWLTQTDPTPSGHLRRDPLYLFAGLAELSWALRVGTVLIEQPPLPWSLWGPLSAMALGGWVCFMVAFCCTAAGWTQHRWATPFFRLLWALLAAGAVLPFLAFALHTPWLLTLWYGSLAAVALPFGIFYCWATMRHPTAMRVPVAVALVLNVAVGLRDWVVFRFTDAFGSNTLTRYSSVVFGLTLGYIVLTRFREVSGQARDLLANLASRVAQKELELAQSYARVEQLARQQERTTERTRILRDMHDGVGSHISAAIRQLQSGKASHDDVLLTLRDSLDQLKLSIDAMNLPPGDVTALLANLRYRLEPRFAASDIELQWDVELLEPLARLDAGAMRQLQFMVFEALSNVLQHAHASRLRIDARQLGAGVQLRIIDNGAGFDVTAPLRKGLLSMHERATAIGATLALDSEPGHTVVEIRLA